MAETIVRVSDLDVTYSSAIRAVRGVSLELKVGSICVIIGANGAGKSSIIRTIAGLVPPSGGTIEFDGQSIAGVPAYTIMRLGAALVPEGRQVFATLTVEQNLRMGAYPVRDSSDIGSRISLMYERFPVLKDRRKQLAGSLSGGEQQMLAIGRALMSRPRVLLMDEPSLGLAPLIVAQLFELTLEIRAGGVSILMAEQNARLALEVADFAYLLENGEVVRQGAAQEMQQDAEVREAYLGG